MGGSTKTTNTNQQTSGSVNLPGWMTQAGQDLYGNASSWAKANPVQAYGGQLAAGTAGNQNAATAAAASGVGTGQTDLNAARMLTGQAANGGVQQVQAGQFDTAAAQKYMDPYVQQVQQNTLQEMQRQNGIDHASLNDSVQASKAYGGTRQALLESEQARNQNKNMMDYLGTSNAQAYTDAQGQFNADRGAQMQAQTTNAGNQQSVLDRMLAAGGQAGQLGTAANDLNTQDITNLSRTGAVDQATQQNQYDTAYQDWLRTQNQPLANYKSLNEILANTPRNVNTTGTMTGTETAKTSGGLLNTLMGIAQLGVSAAGAFSDRRLKRDVEQFDRLSNGLGVYRYRYLWDEPEDPIRIGVMADEVAQLVPEALGPVVAGYATVDYSKIGELL